MGRRPEQYVEPINNCPYQNAASGLSHLHHTVVHLAAKFYRLSTIAYSTNFDSIVDRLKNAVRLCIHVVVLLNEEFRLISAASANYSQS